MIRRALAVIWSFSMMDELEAELALDQQKKKEEEEDSFGHSILPFYHFHTKSLFFIMLIINFLHF